MIPILPRALPAHDNGLVPGDCAMVLVGPGYDVFPAGDLFMAIVAFHS